MSAAEQAKSADVTTVTKESEGALEAVFKATGVHTNEQKDHVKTAFETFVKTLLRPNQVIDKDAERLIKTWIAQIDQKLSGQLDEIMHHPSFQRLEGTWRGLHYLVHESETGETLKIRVLNVSKKDLLKDLERSSEFTESALYKKVYQAEYGVLGGKPYGLLVGDYDFYWHPEDISLLQRISNVAAVAHAPFVAAASAQMFNLERFDHLQNPRDLAKIFEAVDFVKWRAFRDSEDSRYVGLTLPRVLARLPYGKDFKPIEEFGYEEGVDGRDHDKYLWMNSSWAYAARITSAFAKDGWLARIRGVEGGGKVENLPVHTFKTDDGDKVMKCPTEIAIPDTRENELSKLGFLPLLHCKDSDFAAFLGAQSCQKPKEYLGDYGPQATSNAALSAKFNYILCVSRFSHYLKVMARNWVGSFMERSKLESKLNEWIKNYVTATPENCTDDQLAQRPLRQASIEVKEIAGRPGWYEAVAFLRPHFQFEGLEMSMRLVAEVPSKQGS